MKIYRNGVEIELTGDELYNAFREQKAIFNRMDVEEYTTEFYEPEDFKDVFGMTVEEFLPLMEDVIDEYDDREFDCEEAVQNAAFNVIERHRQAKEA